MAKKSIKTKKKGLKVLSGEGKRFSFRNIKQALVFYALLLLALAVIVQLGYHWLGDQYLAWRLQITDAELGYIQRETHVRGLVTRSEEVIKAPHNGMILKMAPSGKRIAAGRELVTFGLLSPREMNALRGSEEQEPDDNLREQLFDYWRAAFQGDNENEEPKEQLNEFTDEVLTGEENQEVLPARDSFIDIITMDTDKAGLISHYVDGWEHYEGPLYLDAAEPAGGNISEGDLVEAGEPLIKIVDNWHWYYSVTMPLHPGRTIAELSRVEFVFDFAPDEIVAARREHYEVDEENQEVRITYTLDKQLPGFDRVRYVEASLLYLRDHGIIVPVEALHEREDGQQGIYLNQGGRVVFQPVSVIRQHDNQLLVEGIAQYSLVITRPELVEEGQRLE